MSGHSWATAAIVILGVAITVAIALHLHADPITYVGPS